ncbi:RyR domain-containing protein [Archangium sp.]|uniref:RyR domain-containing protein n=1 Tax=Archangium sp. TaxID=1872627 RepID=UPI0039C85F69
MQSEAVEATATQIEVIAAACHSAWYAYTVLALGEKGEEWLHAPEWQKESIRDAVRFWLRMGPAAVDIERKSHENWMRQRLDSGWRFGPSKDAEAKTHPCLVDYAELPESQRKKDTVVVQAFRAVSREVLKRRHAEPDSLR